MTKDIPSTRRIFLLSLLPAIFFGLLAADGAFACFLKSSCAAETVFNSYEFKIPIDKNFDGLSKTAALRAQKLFVKKLSASLGGITG